jgi:hypothetical protein
MTILKAYPAGWSRLGVPTSGRREALAGIALYAPSRRRSEIFRDLSLLAVAVLGPRCLPGPASTWVCPVEHDVWDELQGRITRLAGPWDAIAVYGRSGGRSGFTLAVIAGGRQRALMRVEASEAGGVEIEARALQQLASAGPRSFVYPELLEFGAVGRWSYGITAPIAMGAHRMAARPDLASICAELSGAVTPPERGAHVPDHWVPAHGDLTPWNLRARRTGPPALLDWESVTWAPPGADSGLYVISSAAIGRHRRPGDIELSSEVIGYWWEATEARIKQATAFGTQPDALNEEILRLLEAVSRGSGT